MAIHELTEEQAQAWTRAQKDEWWFKDVFKGDAPQLTVRAVLTGFLLGGFLTATSLYIAGKSGVTIGVGLTSVILAFGIFRVLRQLGISKDFSVLENNSMQTIATSAGYMVAPLISSLAALMMMTGKIVPWWQILLWNAVIATMGIFVAFPMKRRFINDDQLPFPEGRACGYVLDTLYTSDPSVGVFKVKVLSVAAVFSGMLQFLAGGSWMKLIQFKILGLHERLGMSAPWTLPENISDWYYTLGARWNLWVPKIFDTDIRELGLKVGIDAGMAGVGGLMGIRVASNVLAGALLNYAVLAPWMIKTGDIIRNIDPVTGEVLKLTTKDIISQWSLWWAIAAMVVGSMIGLLAKPQMMIESFTRLFKKKSAADAGTTDPVKHLEFPLWLSFVGVPVLGIAGAWMAHSFFDARWELMLAAIPLIFILSMIASNAMALTSWTPTGALSKITQFTMGAIDHTSAATNLAAAGMTGEIAGNSANLLSNIKPGYMLGAKPRLQAVGHFIGILSGALASTPLFYVLFLRNKADGTYGVENLGAGDFALPAAQQWYGVAKLIETGLKQLPTSAIVAMVVAAVLALAFEIIRIKSKNKFPVSAVSIGLGVVLPPSACLCMFAGAFVFHFMGKRNSEPGTFGHKIWVDSVEIICAGLITGAALMGVGDAILSVIL